MQTPDEILYSIPIRYPKLKEDIDQVLNHIAEIERQNTQLLATTMEFMDLIPQEKAIEILIQNGINLKP